MRLAITILLLTLSQTLSFAQINIKGILVDDTETPIAFANVILYDTSGTMIKVATTEDAGVYEFQGIQAGTYKLVSSYIGLDDFVLPEVTIVDGVVTDLGKLIMTAGAIELETAVIKAKRAMVEIKPDRTVFNVQGTINSTGDNGMGLLRKAPGVLVDNNNNITVLGRSGVLVYIDGKRLPLSGDDLTAYLENLQADQIDKMDIITNPGSKYEAEGNAGIIDIRLKKDKNLGSNGSINGTFTQGQRARGNISATGNYRNKHLNTFGQLGYNKGENIVKIGFTNYQNALKLVEKTNFDSEREGINYRWGTDFFVAKNHTVGFLISGNNNSSNNNASNENIISRQSSPNVVDSILIANNVISGDRDRATYNINYAYTGKSTVNIDLDYGKYTNKSNSLQPNRYYLSDRSTLLTENIDRYESPSTIDIYTGKIDYETPLAGGKLGLGSKYSNVSTDNTFLYYDILNGSDIRNDRRSNQFDYDERVIAGYANYAGSLSKKVSYSAGLRVEHTDATGILTAYDPSLNEDPVKFDYVSYFPSAGLTYAASRMHNWSLNYGRRINRPDYNVLNPFEEQISELSFSKGNPFLKPEIVNNLELGYTYAYRYNLKIGYSKTTDQITRLIGPDKRDPRAGFISWDNLAEKTVISANLSLPLQINKWWSMYANISASHIDNQADYGDNGKVDLQAFSYSIYQQSTFALGAGYTGEISGYFSGPGIWGGVFEYETSYSLNVGLQKKFFNDKLNVKLSANDLTYQTGWSGVSKFNGLVGEGYGNWDSRYVSLSLGYNFGNSNVKSRKRKTGIENESKRVSQGD